MDGLFYDEGFEATPVQLGLFSNTPSARTLRHNLIVSMGTRCNGERLLDEVPVEKQALDSARTKL